MKTANILEIHHVNQLIRCTFSGKVASESEHRTEGVAFDKTVVIVANSILNKVEYYSFSACFM